MDAGSTDETHPNIQHSPQADPTRQPPTHPSILNCTEEELLDGWERLIDQNRNTQPTQGMLGDIQSTPVTYANAVTQVTVQLDRREVENYEGNLQSLGAIPKKRPTKTGNKAYDREMKALQSHNRPGLSDLATAESTSRRHALTLQTMRSRSRR